MLHVSAVQERMRHIENSPLHRIIAGASPTAVSAAETRCRPVLMICRISHAARGVVVPLLVIYLRLYYRVFKIIAVISKMASECV